MMMTFHRGQEANWYPENQMELHLEDLLLILLLLSMKQAAMGLAYNQ
jgi:hypothetical protein